MIHRFVNSGIELFSGHRLGLLAELVEGTFQTLRTGAASFSDGAGWGSRAIMLTSSSSRKLRPSNFSIAALAEAGRSRAQFIETFSITPLLLILTVALLPKPVVR